MADFLFFFEIQVGRILRDEGVLLNLRDYLSWADFLIVDFAEELGRLQLLFCLLVFLTSLKFLSSWLLFDLFGWSRGVVVALSLRRQRAATACCFVCDARFVCWRKVY
jgi:hypothetical protein